jgi:hypothetical protein
MTNYTVTFELNRRILREDVAARTPQAAERAVTEKYPTAFVVHSRRARA